MIQNLYNQKYFIAIRTTVDTDDFEQFKYLINCDEFSNISKNDKEEIFFLAAYYSKNEKFLNYFIFDYNIAINEIISGYIKIKDMNIKKTKPNNKNNDLILALQRQVEMAIFTNELSRIDRILSPENYCEISHSQKEKYIFETLATQFILLNKGDELLRHFIYKYNISEENSLDIIDSRLKHHLEPMFDLRRINKELGSELKNNDNNIRKIKI
jgi:hypothetical protein